MRASDGDAGPAVVLVMSSSVFGLLREVAAAALWRGSGAGIEADVLDFCRHASSCGLDALKLPQGAMLFST